MTNSDLVNRLAEEHNLTSGRAEMIISIIVERITEKLIAEGHVLINDFGEFTVLKNSLSEMILSSNVLNRTRVVFTPGQEFLDAINSN
jgi:nucleoid DNA-binding protein